MPDTTPKVHFSHKVYRKTNWADDWTEVENLFCDRLTYGSGMRIGAAEFTWRFGAVQSYGEARPTVRTVQDLIDKYVKVELTITVSGTTTYKRWFGIFLDDARDYGGELQSFGSTKPTAGTQRLTAAELTYLLDRVPLDSSFCMIKDGSSNAEEQEVERAIPFNYAGGNARTRRIQGNCDPDGDKGPVFTESLDSAFEWTLRDILDYLVGYHMPKNLTGEEKLVWSAADDDGILVAFNGTIDPHGASVFETLNMALDRRRLLSWYLNPIVDETSATAQVTELEIKAFALNKDKITLPSGNMIGANGDTVEIDLSGEHRVLELKVLRDGGPAYKRVIARGEPVVVIGPIDYDSGNGEFDKDWTSAQETTYETAASSDGGYSSLKAYQKKNANYEYRTSLIKPWRFYKVKPEKLASWLPYNSGTITVNNKRIRLWPPGARFLDVLPLKEDATYTTPSTSISATLEAQSREEYMRPVAWIADGSRYYRMDRMAPGTDANDSPETMGRSWSATVQMRDDTLGFILDIHGAPQHIIGSTDFTQSDTNDGASWPADMDWKQIIVTVAIVTDNWAEAQWPASPTGTEDVAKDLIFYVPNRRMEYLLPDTPFGMNQDGSLKSTTSGGWITDDSEELKDLARIAYEWYQQPRKSVTLTMRTLDCPYSLGQLVTKIKKADDTDLEEVNSVITEITFDLLQGTYTIQTQFAELDPRNLVF